MGYSDRKRITKRNIDALKPTDKDFILWDDQLSGFGVRVKPSGIKSYFIQYRNDKGTSKRYTLGKHGPLTPDMARDLALKEMGRVVSEKADPAKEKRDKLKERTLKELCELYLKEGCKHKKPATIDIDTGRIKRHIIPLLGRKKVTEVTRADVTKMRDDITAGKTSINERTDKLRGRASVTGGEGTAARAVSLLSAIYTYGISKDDGITNNPCKGVKISKGNKNKRYLSPKDFQDLAAALKEAEEHEHPSALNAIRLLIFTGARKSEILTLQWSFIDFENACLHLPESKTGQKIIRLGAPALALLNEIPKEQGNPYVFTGHMKQRHFVGLTRVWHRIRKRRESLKDFRLHDLRHSFASIGVSGGLSLPIVGELLGHADSRTTQRYAHLSADPVKEAVDQISNKIAAAMNGSSAEVIDLKRHSS